MRYVGMIITILAAILFLSPMVYRVDAFDAIFKMLAAMVIACIGIPIWIIGNVRRDEKAYKIQLELDRADDERRKQAAEQRKQELLEERRMAIHAIPRASLSIDDCKVKLHRTSDIAELTYSNITKKSNLDKIKDFTVVDVETTGLSAYSCGIVEVAAVRCRDFIPVEIFCTLVNPGHEIPLTASAINNITDDMVKDAPQFSQIIPSLQGFIGNDNLVGHNLKFDLKFLYRYGLDVLGNRKYYDTLKLAKYSLQSSRDHPNSYDVESFSLENLCKFFSITNLYPHRALGDCISTAELFYDLIGWKLDDTDMLTTNWLIKLYAEVNKYPNKISLTKEEVSIPPVCAVSPKLAIQDINTD